MIWETALLHAVNMTSKAVAVMPTDEVEKEGAASEDRPGTSVEQVCEGTASVLLSCDMMMQSASFSKFVKLIYKIVKSFCCLRRTVDLGGIF